MLFASPREDPNMNRTTTLALLATAGLAATSSAQVALLQGVNSALPNAMITGIEDAPLKASTDFDALAISPDGSRWVFTAFLDSATTTDEVILTGSGPDGSTAAAVVREGDDASSIAAGRAFQTLDVGPRINDAGTVVFSGDFDGSTTDDDFIVTWSGGAYTLVAQELGDSSSLFGAATMFDVLDSPVIDNAGNVGFRATSIEGVATLTDAAIVYNNAVLLQEGVTPIGAGFDLWQNFDINEFRISADGSTWIMQGDTDNPTTTLDDIFAVDGAIVVQENSPHGALPQNAVVLRDVAMTAAGDWFVDGDITDDRDFVLYNGVLLALTDEPTGLPSGELWDDTPYSVTFFVMIGNNMGDTIVAGLTNSADDSANAVLVLNGTTEVMRENDPIDLDGNGMFDDGQFLRTFHDDDMVLTDSLGFYALVTLQDAAGVETGEAFIYKDLSGGTPVCIGDIADDFGNLGGDGMISFGDFLALLGLIGPCPGGTPGCTGDIADDFGNLGGDAMVSFGDFLALLGLIGPCP